MTASFVLDPRLEGDSLPLCETAISLLRVGSDARFPWLILIPRRPALADLIDLSADDERAVFAEVRAASEALRAATDCDKLNTAALGNMVRQLHIHIVARFEGDAAWPGPIWGVGTPEVQTALPQWAVDVHAQLLDAGWSAS